MPHRVFGCSKRLSSDLEIKERTLNPNVLGRKPSRLAASQGDRILVRSEQAIAAFPKNSVLIARKY
ncbi:MAG: hypothetical protein F6K32_14445 [Desertifilum sp. SIO1I2]|nr:hypothetical protein [Desertifilum sp. SIO1I2]